MNDAMRIALVPLYVDYYEDVVPGIRHAKKALIRKVFAALKAHHEVTLFERVTDRQSTQAARRRLCRTQPDCLIVLPLVATFSALSDELVKSWRGPLVLLSAMAATSLPKSMTMIKAVAESQAFGSQAVANGWMRKGRKFHVVHHIPGTKDGDQAIRAVVGAIGASQQLSQLRMGLIGQPFSGMTDIALPAAEFMAHTGARIVKIPMRRIHSLMGKLAQEQRVSFEEKVSQTFRVEKCSAREKEISFRAGLAIQRIVADEKLDCAAFNSHGPEGLKSKKLGLMCALGVTLATSAGCPMSEVGDLCTAFAMWLGRTLGGASFYTELDSAYLSAHEWLLLNSGEYDLAWLRGGFKPKLLPNRNFTGVNGRGASVCAPLREGPATLVNFTPSPESERPFRIQYCHGTILQNWRAEMGVSNAIFKLEEDARLVYERWLAAGPVHHSATSPGHLGHLLRVFCQLRNWSCVGIG